MENSFGIMNKSLQKLLLQSNLHVLFISNVVLCCYILYNMILDGKDLDIETSMVQLNMENSSSYVHQTNSS